MKLAAIAIVSLLPVAACAPAARPEVGFAAAAPKAGAKHAVTLTHDLKLAWVTSEGGQVKPPHEKRPNELSHHKNIACEVKSNSADATAATLVFGDCSEVWSNTLSEAAPTSYAQNCYLVKQGAAGYEVKPDAGEPELTDDDRKATGMMVDHVVGPAPLAPLLAGKTLKKGDKIEVPADIAQKCFGLFSDGANVKSLTLVLAEEPDATADTIVFQAAAKLTSLPNERRSPEMTKEPAGTWSVSKSTCRVVAMAMKGPVTMRVTVEYDGRKLDAKGDGEWTIAWSVATK